MRISPLFFRFSAHIWGDIVFDSFQAFSRQCVRVCVHGRKPAPSFLLAEWMSHSASSLPAHHPAVVPLIDEVRVRRRSEDTGLAAVWILDGESMLPVNTAAACWERPRSHVSARARWMRERDTWGRFIYGLLECRDPVERGGEPRGGRVHAAFLIIGWEIDTRMKLC